MELEIAVRRETAKPSETAVVAAYQVTARILANESQLIWRRVSIFITLNALLVAGLNYAGTEVSNPIKLLIAILAFLYAAIWHVSMIRMWQYHRFYVRLMREQEKALELWVLGPYVRGRKIVEGDSQAVDGERTQFLAPTLMVRAQTVANATTWLFLCIYLVFAVKFGSAVP